MEPINISNNVASNVWTSHSYAAMQKNKLVVAGLLAALILLLRHQSSSKQLTCSIAPLTFPDQPDPRDKQNAVCWLDAFNRAPHLDSSPQPRRGLVLVMLRDGFDSSKVRCVYMWPAPLLSACAHACPCQVCALLLRCCFKDAAPAWGEHLAHLFLASRPQVV